MDNLTLYLMYSELFSISLLNKNLLEAKLYFLKSAKYFDEISVKSFEIQQNFSSNKDRFSIIFDNEKINYKDLTKDNIENIFDNEKVEIAYKKIAVLLEEKMAYNSAINCLKKTIELNPQDYSSYISLGNLYIDLANYQEAIKSFEKYKEYNANNPQIYDVIGVLYSKLDRYDYFDVRINNFKKALELDPNCTDVLRHLAITYRNSGDNQTCTDYYAQLLKLNPTIDDYYDYSLQKLMLGDFQEGLKYFDYRFIRKNNPTYYPYIKKHKWDGSECIKDKKLLVIREQGYGDSIQFLRYLPKVNAKKVMFRVQECLIDLFKYNFPEIEYIPETTAVEDIDFDYHIPIENLLITCHATVDNIPNTKGYIKAGDNKIKEYKSKFFSNNKFKIGIAWCGLRGGVDNRNIPLKYLHVLTQLPNVQIYSLQKDTRGELEHSLAKGINIVDLGQTFNDFCDTAAAVENLDLLISTDNVVGNLGGAMGKKTLLILNKDANWRWLDSGDSSIWYDNMKVFRKSFEKEDWSIVVTQLINEIKNIIKEKD